MSHEQIREAVLYAVGTICEREGTAASSNASFHSVLFPDTKQHEAHTVDTQVRRKRPETSKETLTILTDLLIKQAQLMATELQHFARHANRKVIKSEDVLLCARRQPKIMQSLTLFHQTQSKQTSKKRKSLDQSDHTELAQK
uniref:Uncharacterized protein AlNc14C200G8663 n=1 Tax=Albugo laibachii Nc14 TaxID=890382 RepID=F0WQJ3_9STRA|nr:conserved hypothetical protein [Albugo laibachii Nc14]CCA24163.1 conserved hypothetical protein [Albugo laibachii Nc14]|eukprot:CCA24163.1 conserved hypothetical protein [Albugo laibachii Nc14]